MMTTTPETFKATQTLTRANTSSLTPTHRFQRWSAQHVVDAFQAAGLEIGETKKNDSFYLAGISTQAVEFIRFFVSSRGVDAGGIVFSFSSQEDLDATYKAYKDAGWYDSGLYYPWVYVRANILLQMNGILSDAMAQKYIDVLRALR
jgi:hypothetical protein